MKSIQIQAALNLPNDKDTKLHCTKLAGVYSFLEKNKADIESAVIVDPNLKLCFGRNTEIKWKNGEPETKIQNSGKEMPAHKITVKMKTGNYSFGIPYGNDFYTAICDLLSLENNRLEPIPQNIEEPAIASFILPAIVIDAMQRATKYISKDDLRPSLQCIALTVENYRAQIASTDCHTLFMSEFYKTNMKDRHQVLIKVEDIKRLGVMKFQSEKIVVNILEGNRIRIKNFICSTVDERFPDYPVVVPEYKTFMKFNRADLMKSIKQMLPYTNKSTSCVSLNMNGDIKVSAAEIDFGYESIARMKYLEKNFPDSTIGFNGKFLIELLKNFPDPELNLYTDGKEDRAVLFTNNTDTILIMPLLIK